MLTKCLIVAAALAAVCYGGAVPVAVPAALTVGTYAQSYNAHVVNHAIAAPYVAASPYVAAPAVAPYVAAAPAPFAYSATYPAAAAYHHPAVAAYPAPLIAGRR